MHRFAFAALCAVVASSALAETKDAGAAMDMTKMGPAARKPTDEKKSKREIEDFFKKDDDLSAKGEMEPMLELIDFPVYMATDTLSGKPEAKEYSKDEYVKMMKPFYENMPKDSKTKHKRAITLLSDSLAVVFDDFTMTTGKQKVSGKNMSLLVNADGKWKFKTMVEAGWGGMEQPAAAPAPTPAPAPKK